MSSRQESGEGAKDYPSRRERRQSFPRNTSILTAMCGNNDTGANQGKSILTFLARVIATG